MTDDPMSEPECLHDKVLTAILCAHLLSSKVPLGFMENNADPDDLQAWCYACEYFFQKKKKMSRPFKKFSAAKVVCRQCYEQARATHSI
ncbi:hypothetical protein [Flavilitoribacter nigricans]|uniref:hypothetical protein n=1 Tax=Flavilitoribacter nigricans TaxID=70997 RepID=UPI000C042BC3|nr:hypothetical protein [Flavilitoribacter nigricans]